ncbi:hypothetical protein BHE74_00049908 [Ensete ventricosum]|nr:hypothetical protein BHE74_00049908 [Ensete ventricosum]
MRQTKPFQDAPKTGRGAIGAFWSTEHAKDSAVVDNKGPHFDEPIKQSASTQNPNTSVCKISPPRERHVYLRNQVRIEQGDPVKRPDGRTGEDFEIKFFQEMKQSSNPEKKPASENETFNTFVADFDTGKLNSKNITSDNIPHKRELEAEVDQLKGQLKMANLEKAEITSRCEKLSSVCRSQRQEIQELKHALAAVSPSPPGKDSSKKHENPGSLQSITPVLPLSLLLKLPNLWLHTNSLCPLQLRMKIEGTVWELQQGMMHPSPSPRREIKTWNAFGATNGHQNVMSALNPSTDLWDFNLGSFTASSGSQISGSSAQGNASMRTNSGATKKADANQPAGWAEIDYTSSSSFLDCDAAPSFIRLVLSYVAFPLVSLLLPSASMPPLGVAEAGQRIPRILVAGGGVAGLVLTLMAKRRGFVVQRFEKHLSAVRGEGRHRRPTQLHATCSRCSTPSTPTAIGSNTVLNKANVVDFREYSNKVTSYILPVAMRL